MNDTVEVKLSDAVPFTGTVVEINRDDVMGDNLRLVTAKGLEWIPASRCVIIPSTRRSINRLSAYLEGK